VAQNKTASKTSGKGRTSIATKSMKKSGATRRKKGGDTKCGNEKTLAAGAENEVTIDRRRAPRRSDGAATAEAPSSPAPQLERRQKVNRRRQIDPTTCERDYTDQEVEFMNALDDYKRKSGRMFPTCSEVLEVIHSLGYVKLSPAQLEMHSAGNCGAASAKPMPSSWDAAAVQSGEKEILATACESQLAF